MKKPELRDAENNFIIWICRFDILVNGGGSVTLQFQRQPFQIKKTTVMVPWNRMVTMDVVMLMLDGEEAPSKPECPAVSHDHYLMKPLVLSTWQHTQLGACPSKSTVIPESQVSFTVVPFRWGSCLLKAETHMLEILRLSKSGQNLCAHPSMAATLS